VNPIAGCLVNSNLEVLDAETGESLGFASNNVNNYGQSVLVTDRSQAAVVQPQGCGGTVESFALLRKSDPTGAMAAQADVTQLPQLGCIRGYGSTDNNLGVGSYNYAAIGPVNVANPENDRSVYQRVILEVSGSNALGYVPPVQSLVWRLEPGSTDKLKVQWTNTDGGTVQAYGVLYDDEYTDDWILMITGDPVAFTTYFQVGRAVDFKLAPITA
jgi:hypothetical protein